MTDSRTQYVFSRETVRSVDTEAIDQYGIPGIVLMENAARGASSIAHDQLKGLQRPGRVLIACGPGNNGGDGWAAARHLANRGHEIRICSIGTPREGSDALTNARIAEAMQLPIEHDLPTSLGEVDLIIDALFGTGLDRPISGDAQELIQMINEHSAQTLSMDIPSGLDANTGKTLGTVVRATVTATFVGWKTGFFQEEAFTCLGGIEVVDIGVPLDLLKRHGTPMPTMGSMHGRGEST